MQNSILGKRELQHWAPAISKWHDSYRIKKKMQNWLGEKQIKGGPMASPRTALNLGLLCVVCDTGIFVYLAFRVRDMVKVDDRWEILAPIAIPTATVLGLFAFVLFCLALWPIWNFLTLPLLFTLFMALVVISPYIPPYAKMKPDSDLMRLD